jgi:hypothetical protein
MKLNISKALLILGLTASYGVHAGTMLQPASATTAMGNFSSQYLPTFAINQSALSTSYVSGVTDFDAYTATAFTTLSGGGGFNIWYSAQGVLTGNFDFYLGGAFSIESFALWNDPQSAGQGVNSFTLLAANDAAFTTTTLLGNYSAVEGLGNANSAQVFSFAPTTASYVRVQINSNHGSTFVTGISEAAFEVSAVPEPETYAMMLAGLGFVGCVARWRKHSA